MTEEKEIWKDVLYRGGMYIGYYEVSNLGRVRSVKRQVKQGNHIVSVREKIKKQNIDAHGYPYVTLCKDKKSIPAKIHTLVAEAFIPNPENKPYVDHINTDRSDYRIENLRWVTRQENYDNPISQKRQKESLKKQKANMSQLKEYRLSPTIDVGDFETKSRAARKFLQGGDKVKVSCRFRGRMIEQANSTKELFAKFAMGLEDIAQVDQAPFLDGRNMFMSLSPKLQKKKN